jgi:AraC-like DNA-binding protein
VTLVIDTEAVPAPERVEFWSEASWATYHPLEIQGAVRNQFGARMWANELGPLALFRIATSANTMSRTRRSVAAGDPGCLHLALLLRGDLSVAQQGRAAVLGPGDVMTYDTSQPVIARADGPFEALVVRLPKPLLGRHAPRMSRLTAVTIPGSRGLTRLAARFLRGLAEGLEEGTITSEEAAGLSESVLELGVGLYADRTAPAARAPQSRIELLLRAKTYIEENLGRPELDPEQIAHASFISTRYLHKLFESEGASVCDWIRTARLERCRRDLLDPTLRDETILAIASRWGLPSAAHFSRLFRAAYGCSPSELRRERAYG